MFTLIRKLPRIHLLTVAGLFYLLEALLTTGVNLMALLHLAAGLRPNRIADQEFGQRLKAVVVRKRGAQLDPSTLLAWLKPRVARYQMSAVIEFRDEPPTQLWANRTRSCCAGEGVQRRCTQTRMGEPK